MNKKINKRCPFFKLAMYMHPLIRVSKAAKNGRKGIFDFISFHVYLTY